jgi:hypothetical protein
MRNIGHIYLDNYKFFNTRDRWAYKILKKNGRFHPRIGNVVDSFLLSLFIKDNVKVQHFSRPLAPA